MRILKNKINYLLMLFVIAAGFSSCVKDEFDAPVTANVDPAGIAATHTIAQVQSMAVANVPTPITTDIVISGVIIADDESGSIYKEIIISDSTGGISIQVDVSNFNTNYPMGRRVFVKCKGLYVMKDADGNYEIGFQNGADIARIPQTLYEQYVIKGMWGLTVTPTVISLGALNSVKTNTLVQINNCEFIQANAGVTYADAPNLRFKNLTIKDCANNDIILYTSGYAKFASDTTPTGNGTIIAVYKRYSGDGELILRNTSDVRMDSTRCNGNTGNAVLMPIDSLRMLHTGTTTFAPADKKIKGIVISDISTAHINSRNVVIQDGTAGILVRFEFGASNIFFLGDEIEVIVSGLELSEFNGLLQVNNVPLANAVKVGTGTITPRVATVAQILSNAEAWESTLVQIQNATISGSGSTYSGSRTVTDVSGSMVMFTSSSATFSAQTYPVTPVTITSIVSQYNIPTPPGYQLSLRNPALDVQ
ncbi:MAG: hypothetical protein DWQ44_02580 [Bacteroidetes bacterium]|nr:MAG: hypothetical protein DWQ33_06310 [Bacteroidota bacterium]REK04856.1 MAG: hypothetical protein DWQ39_06475 [Bacteroidota bacterium]REK36328.1 MAG: hypothetical protein DWQ44_02580 [Bacteroidota bacterium]